LEEKLRKQEEWQKRRRKIIFFEIILPVLLAAALLLLTLGGGNKAHAAALKTSPTGGEQYPEPSPTGGAEAPDDTYGSGIGTAALYVAIPYHLIKVVGSTQISQDGRSLDVSTRLAGFVKNASLLSFKSKLQRQLGTHGKWGTYKQKTTQVVLSSSSTAVKLRQCMSFSLPSGYEWRIRGRALLKGPGYKRYKKFFVKLLPTQ
jgi:hypothetical protein